MDKRTLGDRLMGVGVGLVAIIGVVVITAGFVLTTISSTTPMAIRAVSAGVLLGGVLFVVGFILGEL